jgi:23S rRNA pseudouridine1911/1915/1917 synthase
MNYIKNLNMTEPKKLISNILTIFYEDPHLLVLSKPAGLLSQSDHTEKNSLVTYLRTYFGRHYVGLVHRLDRNTSGLMVVAKRSKSAQRLTESLQKGKLIRLYRVLLLGEVKNKTKLVHWLKKNEKTNKATIYPKKTHGAKECQLTLTPLKTLQSPEGALSYCEVELETGRSHQIRAQCSFEGHPLLGDSKYGKPSLLIQRPALHSHFLSFPHPITQELLTFTDQDPKDFVF